MLNRLLGDSRSVISVYVDGLGQHILFPIIITRSVSVTVNIECLTIRLKSTKSIRLTCCRNNWINVFICIDVLKKLRQSLLACRLPTVDTCECIYTHLFL